MATTVVDMTAGKKSNPRVREHRFFWGMSVLIALIVFVGFSRTYFLAGYFHAKPLPAPIVHVHAAAFTSWIVLLVIQASLPGSGRTDIHRRLGLVGLVLAPLVFLLGIAVATEMLTRLAWNAAIDARGIYAVALGEILGFGLPVFFAFQLRKHSAYHKRLILIGTIAMMTAGFGRWPIHFLLHRPLPAMLCTFTLLLIMIAYDLASMRRVHPATALASAWVVCMELTGEIIGHTALWHGFTADVLRLAA